ncbi:hypothetical protein MBLNU459_g5739t2 [Dothideomycetes sp. NU459]
MASSITTLSRVLRTATPTSAFLRRQTCLRAPFGRSASLVGRVTAVTAVRHSSHSPLGTAAPTRKKVTLPTINSLYRRNEPITMITAHDFPSAHVADQAGMDMILVGDSLAMVALGMEDTSEVLMEEMLLHCRSVARGAKSAFIVRTHVPVCLSTASPLLALLALTSASRTPSDKPAQVGDLPMGTYEISPSQALGSAITMVKTGRVQAVKLEGGLEMASTIATIATAGIPVLGHIGLTPQRQNSLGGFRVQGKSTSGALKLLQDALAVQEAGAFAVVLEAVPAEVASVVTKKLRIPTIGIGAGNGCSGQVLVQVDMSGYFPPGRFLPKFVKKFGDVWGESTRAITEYRDEVKSRQYPAPEHTYPMPKEELAEFERLVGQMEKDVV